MLTDRHGPHGARHSVGSEMIGAMTTTILNLGCGTRTSPQMVNIDFSIYQRLRKSPIGPAIAAAALNGYRREQFDSMHDDVVVHNLRKGIPAESNSVDAVYHSHVFEHIDRDAIPGFLAEVLRVLRPGGVQRIVVPDLETLVRDYLDSLNSGAADHDVMVSNIFLQCTRREAAGTSLQRPLRRRIENLVLGSARRRGETHQWMWDRRNLQDVLEEAGFVDVKRVGPGESDITNWETIGLDLNPDGTLYKPQSLFVEARKPQVSSPPNRSV